MKRAAFAQVVAATATAFNADLKVDRQRTREHLAWLLDNGCDGAVLFGSTGESASLTFAERRAILEDLVAAGVPAQRLLVGTGCCTIEDTIALSDHAVSMGCAGALIHPPFFFKGVADEGVEAFYCRVIDGLASPNSRIYLYHFPQTTGVGISPALTGKLLRRYPDNIAGYKDSSGVFENTLTITREFPMLEVFVATESRLVEFLAAGGAGCISATANVQPGAIRRLLNAGTTERATALQAKVVQLRSAIEGPQVVSRVKALLAEIHGDEGWRTPRPPLTSVTAAEIRSMLQTLGMMVGDFAPLEEPT
ncbi:MAG TPA: dihydrodipicolinate synthase family protein [Steroidobacteraceae bacterium]|nr:dihydrodipicolinate synthase family protein [Steroidobacteraceae bacterium]HRX88274.1 dihydrodipicolinate synthase family protein [Steroidobacteraceae bacterium]